MPPTTDTAEQDQTPAFRIFNQGARLFTHHELQLQPGKFTDIPSKYAEAVTKLLKMYPTELISADVADKRAALLNGAVTALQAKVADLEAQLAKAKDTSGNDAIITGLTERVTIAERDHADVQEALRASTDRVLELERINSAQTDKISALDADLTAANVQIAKLTTDLDEATKPQG